MKIALVNYTAYPFHGYGGAERYIYKLSKELVKKGLDVDVICTGYKKDGPRTVTLDGVRFRFAGPDFYGTFKFDETRNAYLRISSGNGRSKFQQILGRLSFWAGVLVLVKKNRYEIVHSFSDSGFPVTFSTQNHVATIFDIGNRGLSMQGLLSLFSLNKENYYSATTTRIVNEASIVTTGGKDNTEELMQIFGCDERKIKTLNNAVELDEGKTLSKNVSDQFRSELGFKAESFVMVFSGRLEPLKQPLLGLLLFEELRKIDSSIDLRILVIGNGSLAFDVDEKIEELNQTWSNCAVRLSDITDESLSRALVSCDLYLNVARTRYMLLSVMEAMLCGLPVISLEKLDGIVINGHNGYVADQISRNELVNLIHSLLSDRHKLNAWGLNSKESAKRYTWKNVAKQAEEIYAALH